MLGLFVQFFFIFIVALFYQLLVLGLFVQFFFYIYCRITPSAVSVRFICSVVFFYIYCHITLSAEPTECCYVLGLDLLAIGPSKVPSA